jgi:uncharacterized protein
MVMNSLRFMTSSLGGRREYTPAACNQSSSWLVKLKVVLMNTPHLHLSDIEVRVLGSLIEKDITTPDYYPLSLNALLNACNQKNNRDPVMMLEEETVRQALASLQEKRLAGPAGGADSRVTKYEHRMQEVFNLERRETALVCVLLLRGPQTPGELRGRCERMYRFESLEDVPLTLQRLIDRNLVRVLPRQPGTKESRYMHLFSGDVAPDTLSREVMTTGPEPVQAATAGDPVENRVYGLESEIATLKRELAELRREFYDFKRQL